MDLKRKQASRSGSKGSCLLSALWSTSNLARTLTKMALVQTQGSANKSRAHTATRRANYRLSHLRRSYSFSSVRIYAALFVYVLGSQSNLTDPYNCYKNNLRHCCILKPQQ